MPKGVRGTQLSGNVRAMSTLSPATTTGSPWLDFTPVGRLHPASRPPVPSMAEVAKNAAAEAAPEEAAPAPELLQRAKARDVVAFRELYARHKRQVAKQLAFLVPRADVEDVLQDVFVEVFRSLGRFEGRSAFSTWLYRVVIHVAMKARRKSSRSPAEARAELPEAADPSASPAEGALTRERLSRAAALLERLSPKKRTVLVLHDMRGVEAQRIAELTDSNIMTVRTRLFYARREFEALASADPALADFFRGGES